MPKYPGAKQMGETKNNGGHFAKSEPRWIVMHYTAGLSGKQSADYLFGPHDPASSAQFVVDRDGTVYQLCDSNTITWHAGKSFWRGVSMLNSHAIGIEFANLGFMKRGADGQWMTGASNYRTAWKPSKGVSAEMVTEARHKNTPNGQLLGWEPYTSQQIEAGVGLTTWILKTHSTIKEIVGHDDIAPLRKQDPGPAFPMTIFVNLLHPDSDTKPTSRDEYVVNTPDLNVRGGPSVSFERLTWGPLSKGDEVIALKREGNWTFVRRNQKGEGWVFSQYITPK